MGAAIAAGTAHTCALFNGGTIKCWGDNHKGQLGLGDKLSRGYEAGQMGHNLKFVDLGTGHTAAEISLGYKHTCARLVENTVRCWGENVRGQVGNGISENWGDTPGEMGDALPVNLGTNLVATQISAGAFHTCALLGNGRVKCWGNGQTLGLGSVADRGSQSGEMGDSLPLVELGASATAVSAGAVHTCAILVNGSVKCWGNNDNGQLGLGDTNTRGDEPGEMGDNLPAVKLFSDVW
ncbi:MAG: hypothetical protein IPM54_26345 [Polyangiaceae bacterium]|nr:hypothetical protein [Polyangiaceae bacterium]